MSSVASVREREGGRGRDMERNELSSKHWSWRVIDGVMRVQEGREKWVLFIITQGKSFCFQALRKHQHACLSDSELVNPLPTIKTDKRSKNHVLKYNSYY